jgi:NusA-like KH domain protein
MKTLDMRLIRYLNLFEKVTRVRTKNCFFYNNAVFFVVPYSFISRAIGENGSNVRKISEIIGKKVKIVRLPEDERDLREFVSAIVQPVQFKEVNRENGELIIVAGRNKAALIGRGKVRLEEMKSIVDQYFGIKNVRIV